MQTTWCGIFVGGRARRMGGIAKGLLPAPDTGEPLVVRLARIAEALSLEPVLVGEAEAYRAALPQLRIVPDAQLGIGPLGGLAGLLAAAPSEHVLTLACDLPFVSRALLARLAQTPSEADVLAPRAENGRWESLFARYRVQAVQPALVDALAQGERSFQQLFARCTVEALALDEGECDALKDWDRPEDREA